MQSIWIFAINSPQFDANLITHAVTQNLQGLQSHGKPIHLSVELREERFLIVRDLDIQASGCSIDKMRAIITSVLSAFGLEIAPASDIFYKAPDGTVQSLDFRQIPQALSSGLINANTPVFDPAAVQQNDLSHWIKPLKDTFLARYLPLSV